MKLPTKELRLAELLPSSIEGKKLCARTVAHDGRVALLFSSAKSHWQKVNDKWIVRPDAVGDAAIIIVESEGRCVPTARFRIPCDGVKFDLLPGGGWVVTRQNTKGLDKQVQDTTVHDASGAVTATFRAGGAVDFMQCNEVGQIVIGHGDEGGDAEGLNCYSSSGAHLFNYYYLGEEDEPDFGLASWCCYALNVTDDAIWTQYYAQMLVTKIQRDGQIYRWRPLHRGARALAIAGNYIGLVGRYDQHVTNLFVYRLDEAPKSKVVAISKLLCDGVPLTHDDEVIGRGDTFYIFKGPGLYKLSLRDIPGVAA